MLDDLVRALLKGKAYLLARLGRLDPDAAPFGDGHYRRRRVVVLGRKDGIVLTVFVFCRLVARPATVSCRLAARVVGARPALRRRFLAFSDAVCVGIFLSFLAANADSLAAFLCPPVAVWTGVLRQDLTTSGRCRGEMPRWPQ